MAHTPAQTLFQYVTMATFDSLPSELVAEIIEYVDVEDFDDDGPGRIKDMQNVRLVTRQVCPPSFI